jgi:signal recognition particle receptor subunit beta
MRGADGVVFVADSQSSKMTENLYSRADLDEILLHYGQDPETFPTVIQYNKRDLKDISSVDELSKALNPRFNLEFQSVAITGENVMETLKGISQSVIKAGRKRHMQ